MKIDHLDGDVYHQRDADRYWLCLGSFTAYEQTMSLSGIVRYLSDIEAKCPQEVRSEIALVQHREESYSVCPNDWELLIVRPLTKAETAAREAMYTTPEPTP